jgi:putative hydrolase of the HAD superfamily
MYRWIAFDAVGTLIYPEPDVATAYANIGQRHGSHLTPAELRLRFRSTFAESTAACLPSEDGHILTSEDLERARWQWIVQRTLSDVTDSAKCFAELFGHFARPENWRLYDDVSETLSRVRQRGFRIAIASNFDQRLHGVCRGFPVLMLMVGDDFEADVAGPERLGIRAVHINRDRSKSSLSELIFDAIDAA